MASLGAWHQQDYGQWPFKHTTEIKNSPSLRKGGKKGEARFPLQSDAFSQSIALLTPKNQNIIHILKASDPSNRGQAQILIQKDLNPLP